ncbi:uncharacterized protein VTP21DRAFT_10470 [Calcarisporiella thermophila]|uniref:uncharacterized protein n=1 Tax=Calcarisporiella thermophila TaxID=911321 RepID=UPI0037420284
MASKKATLFILDVGPSMSYQREDGSSGLQEGIRIITQITAEKISAGRKTDNVACIAYGTDGTRNNLATEPGQYEHVTVLQDFAMGSLQFLKHLQYFDGGSEPGDCLDALIVGLEAMSSHCKHYKYEKKIYLITDGKSPINFEDLDVVEEQIKSQNIQFFLIGVDFAHPEVKQEDEDGIGEADEIYHKRKNEKALFGLVNKVDGAFFTMQDALEEIVKYRPKTVHPVPVYRGELTLGDSDLHFDTTLSIPVQVYNRTAEVKLPTAKKWSCVAATSGGEYRTHEVSMQRTYKIKPTGKEGEGAEKEEKEDDDEEEEEEKEEEEQEVDEASLTKGYIYGKDLIPIYSYDEDALKLRTIKSFCILGFINAREFPREYSMSNITVVLPQAGDTGASLLLSALARALDEKEMLAVARYVRIADAPPKVGVLYPEVRGTAHCLFFAQTPFAEDVRRYNFAPLDRVITRSGKILKEHERLPTEEMLEKAEAFVKAWDLTELNADEQGNPTEYLAPEHVVNPTYHYLSQCIQLRALNKEIPLPPMDERLREPLQPLPSLLEKSSGLLQEMQQLFGISKVDKEERGKKRGRTSETTANEKQTQASEASLASIEAALSQPRTTRDVPPSKTARKALDQVRLIRITDPIRDFQAMIANKEEDLVETAVHQMFKIVEKLVLASSDNQDYALALECLKSVREVCGQENESDAFNAFLRDFCSLCRDSNSSPFLRNAAAAGITLIHRGEPGVYDTTCTAGEAEKFLRKEMGYP